MKVATGHGDRQSAPSTVLGQVRFATGLVPKDRWREEVRGSSREQSLRDNHGPNEQRPPECSLRPPPRHIILVKMQQRALANPTTNPIIKVFWDIRVRDIAKVIDRVEMVSQRELARRECREKAADARQKLEPPKDSGLM